MLTAFHLAGCFGTRQPTVGCGAMAQLVARLHGMQKVRGSNPLSSTAGQRPVPISEIGLLRLRTAAKYSSRPTQGQANGEVCQAS